jgi:hypothetical protein
MRTFLINVLYFKNTLMRTLLYLLISFMDTWLAFFFIVMYCMKMKVKEFLTNCCIFANEFPMPWSYLNIFRLWETTMNKTEYGSFRYTVLHSTCWCHCCHSVFCKSCPSLCCKSHFIKCDKNAWWCLVKVCKSKEPKKADFISKLSLQDYK